MLKMNYVLVIQMKRLDVVSLVYFTDFIVIQYLLELKLILKNYYYQFRINTIDDDQNFKFFSLIIDSSVYKVLIRVG